MVPSVLGGILVLGFGVLVVEGGSLHKAFYVKPPLGAKEGERGQGRVPDK